MFYYNISCVEKGDVVMISTGIVGTQKPISFLPPVGCDLPEQGGIGGNIVKDTPKPFVLEERPKTFNFKTGKWEYVDQQKPKFWVA